MPLQYNKKKANLFMISLFFYGYSSKLYAEINETYKGSQKF